MPSPQQAELLSGVVALVARLVASEPAIVATSRGKILKAFAMFLPA
jgi:hypothetical protein